ncbi:protein kinase, partial [bacterium]|nr:protein kinase [bacterium]
VDHPNIVKVFASQIDELLLFPFLVMEFIHGRNLSECLDDYKKDPICLFRHLITILESINFCHQKGIVHRDLKPENIMLTPEGVIKIIDFGIARSSTQDNLEGFALGTPQYMAPEQFMGKSPTSRSDVYSLGIMVWEFLTGKPPFLASPKSADQFLEMAEKHMNSRPPIEELTKNPCASSIADVIASMISKKPEERPEIPLLVEHFKQHLFSLGGSIAGIYDVERVIATEKTVQVFKARDNQLRREVAIRMLSPIGAMDLSLREIFLEKCRKLAAVKHSSLPEVYSIACDPLTGLPFIVMEYINEADLKTLKPDIRKDAGLGLRIMKCLLESVQFLHSNSVVHGNLDVQQVLSTKGGAVKIIGFDLTSKLENEDPKQDINSLGRVFSELNKFGKNGGVIFPSLQIISKEMEEFEGKS